MVRAAGGSGVCVCVCVCGRCVRVSVFVVEERESAANSSIETNGIPMLYVEVFLQKRQLVCICGLPVSLPLKPQFFIIDLRYSILHTRPTFKTRPC